MAHKKAGGSSRNGRDSESKRLGVKAYGGELVTAGSIIIRQRGTRYHAGAHVGTGKDHTLFAMVPGKVKFATKGPEHDVCTRIAVNPSERQESAVAHLDLVVISREADDQGSHRGIDDPARIRADDGRSEI